MFKVNLDVFCTMYLDNSLIFSGSTAVYNQLPLWVLQYLHSAALHTKVTKYTFGLLELKYLGHGIYKDGLQANLTKFKTLQKCPQTANLGELQSFFGIANYHSKFVHSFLNIVSPLYKLLYKDIKWIQSPKHTKSMHAKALSSLPVLCLSDFHTAFQLETNSLNFAIGSALVQC